MKKSLIPYIPYFSDQIGEKKGMQKSLIPYIPYFSDQIGEEKKDAKILDSSKSLLFLIKNSQTFNQNWGKRCKDPWDSLCLLIFPSEIHTESNP